MDYRIKILELFIQLEGCTITHDLISDLFGDYDEKMLSFRRLVGDRMLTLHKGEYILTEQGREHYKEAVARLYGSEPGKAHGFKVEALTGLVERKSQASGFMVTEESQLDNVALPSGGEVQHYASSPEDYLMRQATEDNTRYAIMRDLSLSADRFEDYLEEGRIQVCTKGQKHLGVFDRNGNGWRSCCRECRKKK